MTEPRFTPPIHQGTNCLNCKHHELRDKNIWCQHPQRPEPALVVRWFPGCPQHEPKKES